MTFDLIYQSYGGGVQSKAMMVCAGLGLYGVPKPDVAIFADTKAEIAATYEDILQMTTWGADHGIRLVTTSKGSLEDDVLVGVLNSQVSIPAFIKVVKTVKCDCTLGREDSEERGQLELLAGEACEICGGVGTVTKENRGIMRRQCTYDYKLMAIQAEVRRQLGLKKGQVAKGKFKVRAMLGISLDEVIRMKPSKTEWVEHYYPLIEARLTRDDCKRILIEQGMTVPPRSACYFCPFHRDPYWYWLKNEHPVEFAKAVEFDKKVRTSKPKLEGAAFLHDSLKPLGEIDFDQKAKENGFGNECEGMCGV